MDNQKYLPKKEAMKFFGEKKLNKTVTDIEKFIAEVYNNVGKRRGRTIAKGYIAIQLEQKNLLNEFIEKYWANGKTEDGEKIINRYKNQYFRYSEDPSRVEPEEPKNIDNSSFAYEADLRDYLAKNLKIIEEGLVLYKDKDGKNGIEYSVDEQNKRIDILAIDKNKNPVIIELKVNRGYEKVIGQCQYYKNKIKKLFNVNKVRVIIIARQITDYLKMATMDMDDYELFEYKLNIELSKIIGHFV
jgi:hypothetical protein